MSIEYGPSPEQMGLRPEDLKIESQEKNTSDSSANQETGQEETKPDIQSAEAGTKENVATDETPQLENVKRALDVAEGHFQKLEQDLTATETLIEATASLEAGSREKYDAAFKMRDEIEGISFADATVGAVLDNAYTSRAYPRESIKDERGKVIGHTSEAEYPPEIQAARQKLQDLRSRKAEITQRMMEVWRTAKQEYEGMQNKS